MLPIDSRTWESALKYDKTIDGSLIALEKFDPIVLELKKITGKVGSPENLDSLFNDHLRAIYLGIINIFKEENIDMDFVLNPFPCIDKGAGFHGVQFTYQGRQLLLYSSYDFPPPADSPDERFVIFNIMEL